MNFKLGMIFIIVVILVLVVALAVTKKQGEDRHLQSTELLLELSNRLDTAGVTLDDLHQINLTLTNDLASMSRKFETTSNNLSDTAGQLTRTKSEFGNVQDHVTDLTDRVGDLQPGNQELGKRAFSLSNNFVLRNDQSADVQQQLATSQSNNTVLAAKLQDVMTQKSEWQRRFNDLDEVRAQLDYLAYGFY
jgi:chromosome segregation ATPase